MRFGVSEVIRPYSTEKVMSEKKQYLFGEVTNQVEKISESFKGDDKEAISQAVKAIKQAQALNTDYVCIEIFTDRSGIERTNVCHMRVIK